MIYSLPDEILDNIKQYKNFRVQKGEIIPQLDLNDCKIKHLEARLKLREDCSHEDHGTSMLSEYWVKWTNWKMSEHGSWYRFIAHEYIAATNEVIFKYKRRRTSFSTTELINWGILTLEDFAKNDICEVTYFKE